MNPYFAPNHVLTAELAECVYGYPLMDKCSRLRIDGLQMPSYSWYAELLESEKEWLDQLQKNPSGLEKMEAALQADIPIGKRFESFIRFWLEHGPSFDLLASNVQVFRAGQTLGEFDFICRDRNTGEVVHMEVACKYYLGYANRPSWENWAGPNREDRLSEKMKRFVWQFGLEETPEGSLILERLATGRCRRLLLLKGMFFHHVESLSKHKSPYCSGSHYRSGWFLHENEMDASFPGGDTWILPERNHWLRRFHAGSPEKDNGNGVISGRIEALKQIRRKLSQTGKAVMACRVEEFGNLLREESRGFILPGKRLNPDA